MLFSPESMNLFQTREIQLSPTRETRTPYFHLRGSVGSVMAQIQSIHADGSQAGRAAKNYRDDDEISRWCGFRGQTLSDAFSSGSITAAIEDFQKAQAKMSAPPQGRET